MKTCRVCKETKEIDQFDRRKNAKGEIIPTTQCKACRRIYTNNYIRKKSKTGLTREEWLNTVRKPKLSPEERLEAGKAKWEAWYSKNKDSMKKEYRKKAEQEREARLATGVKVCSICKKEKPLSEYHMRNRKRKDNSVYQHPYASCKPCRRENNRYYEKTPNGKVLKRNNSNIREKRNKLATPKWLTKEQKKRIIDIYEDMRRCRGTTGEEYHVDHIIPIRGKNVCGLHVPWNLRVIKASDNLSKGNEIVESIYTEGDVT